VSLYALNVRGLTLLVRGETDEAGVSVWRVGPAVKQRLMRLDTNRGQVNRWDWWFGCRLLLGFFVQMLCNGWTMCVRGAVVPWVCVFGGGRITASSGLCMEPLFDVLRLPCIWEGRGRAERGRGFFKDQPLALWTFQPTGQNQSSPWLQAIRMLTWTSSLWKASKSAQRTAQMVYWDSPSLSLCEPNKSNQHFILS